MKLIFMLFLLAVSSAFLCPESVLAAEVGSADHSKWGYSEGARQNMDYELLAQPVGWGPAATISNAMTLGYFLEPNSVLELEFLKGRSAVFFGDFFDSLKKDVQTIGVYNKKFLRNTFYLRYGANYRSVDYQYSSANWFGGTSAEEYAFKGTAFAVSLGLGNQWQWQSGFTLGCEWLAIEVPFGTQLGSESYGGSKATLDELHSREDQILKDIGVNLVHFYLGASF